MRILSACLLSTALTTAAAAQDQPNTILVLDGSGSMWGQIDGVAKITIAQDVVGGLLGDFPSDQGLGLTVYGHRERGNCTDIETIVAPTTGTADDILSAVKGIKPLGKTPMTDAVIAAAEALRYTEDSATVILVSDGVETCNPDPCAAARLLEEAGINFTAHVVGFDVSDPEALAQMQCIADETGGQFLTASNADELDLAMTAMVTDIPEPATVDMTFSAVIGAEDRLIDTPILWTITDEAGTVLDDAQGNPLTQALAEGAYTATAYSVAAEDEGSAQFIAIAGGNTSVQIMFEQKLPTARVIAPSTGVAGDTIQVGWSGPEAERDFIAVGAPDDNGYINFTYVRDGNPLDLDLPPLPGSYEIRYVLREGAEIIARQPITVTAPLVNLTAPEAAIAGSTVDVDWVGPDYERDYLAVAVSGDNSYINFSYTRDGSPLGVEMPAEPGDYELRYIMRQDNTTLATRPISVTQAQVSLTAPDTAAVGETVMVDWTGPNYDLDFIAVGSPGDRNYINYSYTRDGSPLGVEMPAAPGDYELRYTLRQDNEVIATRPISVTQAQVSLTAPDSAIAGSTVAVDWTGPDYDLDFIAVGKPGDGYDNYTYTRDGSPAQVEMPTEPGTYELRYTLRQDNTILRTRPIEITAVKASIDSPATANAGETLSLTWDGPDYDLDFISVGPAGNTRYENYTYTSEGSPIDLLMPAVPGDYEIRYQLRQDNKVVFRQAITVNAVKAQLLGPDSVTIGDELIVGWDGPGYDGDFFGVSLPGDDGYESFSYTSDGNPLSVRYPDAPGTYELRYFIGQDRVVIGTKPLTITE